MTGKVLFKAVWYPEEKPPKPIIQIPRVRWTAFNMRPSVWREFIKTFEYSLPERGGPKELERTEEVAKMLRQMIPSVEQWWRDSEEIEEYDKRREKEELKGKN